MLMRVAAERFGINYDTMRGRSQREQWRTEKRVKRDAREAAPSKDWQGLPTTGLNETESQLQQSRVSDVDATLSRLPREARLAALAGVDPAAYQETLATILEELAAEGIGEMEPPRSPGELARVNDAIRKARRMDVKQGQPAGFVRPLRTLTRQPALELDITPSDPLEGFPI